MGMQYYAQYGIGLAIVDEEIEPVRKSVIEKLGLDEDCYENEIADYLQKKGYVQYENTDTSSGLCVTYLNRSYVYPNDVLFVYAEKQPRPFEAAYKNKRELAKEFEQMYKDIFPENFNFKDHLAWFECATMA